MLRWNLAATHCSLLPRCLETLGVEMPFDLAQDGLHWRLAVTHFEW